MWLGRVQRLSMVAEANVAAGFRLRLMSKCHVGVLAAGENQWSRSAQSRSRQ